MYAYIYIYIYTYIYCSLFLSFSLSLSLSLSLFHLHTHTLSLSLSLFTVFPCACTHVVSLFMHVLVPCSSHMLTYMISSHGQVLQDF